MPRKRTGARTYDSYSEMSSGGGNALRTKKGGLRKPPMQTDTKAYGADPGAKKYSSHGANVTESRLPKGGAPRRSMRY